MKTFTTNEKQLIALLKKQYIKNEDLKDHLSSAHNINYKTTRCVRAFVERLRRNGYVVISFNQKKGYKIATKRSEMEYVRDTYNKLQAQALSLLVNSRSAKNWIINNGYTLKQVQATELITEKKK